MSTQNRNSGGGGSRSQKKSNSGAGGGGNDSVTQNSVKKTDHNKPEKEKSHPKPTAEQLRIAQITNSNTAEDPQIREKVATLIEMTQRSEEEVCCALNECDNNLERAVVFLLETLPVGAFETSSKKKKKQAANAAQESAGGDGDWADSNANDRREKSRNRSSNRGGRGGGGGGDNRGWRGRDGRENDRHVRGDRSDRADRGERPERGDRSDRRDRDDRAERGDRFDREERNENYRGNRAGGRGGGGRGGGYIGRGGRGGGRGGGGRSFNSRGERGAGGNRDYRSNVVEEQEVELWDNTIAQNAEKQQQQATQDDAWGDWDNEEYVGSLKDSKVFTSSTLGNQAVAAGVVSGNVNVGVGLGTSPVELSAPPGLEQHLGTSILGGSTPQQGSHLSAIVGSAVGAGGNISNTSLVDDNVSVNSSVNSTANTPLLQYSAAVTNNQMQQQQNVSNISSTLSGASVGTTQFNTGGDTFSNAANAAANLVQQAQQQQQQQNQQSQLKASATLSAEQSQYFNSLTSQNSTPVQQQQQVFGQSSTYSQTAGVQYPTSYANVFANSQVSSDQSQLTTGQQTQVRRARAKLPPPSKIPATAVEMPGDAMNNMAYIDVQFGALDFNNDESFEGISDKFNSAVTIDGQASTTAQQKSSPQDLVTNDYQNKAAIQQQNALAAGLQDSLTAASAAGYNPRGTPVQQAQVSSNVNSGSVVAGNNALEQLTKNDPYTQNNASNNSYQNTYQPSSNKTASNAYQPSSASAQNYNSSSFTNVQTSAYSQQSYGAYPQNSVNSYQPPTAGSAQNVQSSVSGSNVNTTQNIPVGGNTSSSSVNTNSSSGYLSSGYQSQPGAYQSGQSVYGSTGLSNSSGYSSNTSNSAASQYSNFSASAAAKLKETSTTSGTSHYESVSGNSGVSSAGQVSSNNTQSAGVTSSTTSNSISSLTSFNGLTNSNGTNSSTANNNNNTASNNQTTTNVLSNSSGVSSNSNSNNNVSNNNANNISTVGVSGAGSTGTTGVTSSNAANNSQSTVSAVSATSVSTTTNKSSTNAAIVTAAAAAASANNTSGSGGTSGGMVPPNIQMVSQYIQSGMPYYQPPVYSFEELQMMQQRVPHVQGYYDLNYTPTSLSTGRDNMGSVAYSTMTDGRFARTDNNSSPVSSTMSQQAGSGGHMLNVPYAYFYNANAMMPGSFQYGTHTIYPQQLPAANTASGVQFPKPSYNAGYGSASYDTLSQASQDYNKGAYQTGVNQQTKTQSVTNPPQAGTGSDISNSMYGKGHVALNKVNSYEKQNFHSGTPPPFNMANTQTAGGTSAQPYGMYLPMPAAGHHNMMHQQIHQMAGSIHYPSRGDSNSTGQRQQTTNQSKPAGKQGYSPSYWNAGQN